MQLRRVPALLIVAALAAACGSSPSPSLPASAGAPTAAATPGGRSEPESPAPSIAPAPASSPAPGSSTTGGPAPTPRFTLTTAAFQVNGAIPSRFTCDGRDVSPAIAWTGVPAGTTSLVLIVDDLDAHNFTHWIAYVISPGTTRLAEGAGAADSTKLAQGANDFGHVGYGGPCPPSGKHRYVFTLSALAAPLGLDGSPNGATVRAALAKADVLGKATITATYARTN